VESWRACKKGCYGCDMKVVLCNWIEPWYNMHLDIAWRHGREHGQTEQWQKFFRPILAPSHSVWYPFKFSWINEDEDDRQE